MIMVVLQCIIITTNIINLKNKAITTTNGDDNGNSRDDFFL
jgi:hypothetical protein